ncbi:uncharacterized protein LOC133896942 [Phragmites australis]|uniref:uncharacterized protein LOC133896942 n=1 Tax=Phragmites australis TaxID=29695 RepID=UPI002D7A2ECF|nr:uncharacterized protein LOC133896942 [Phragmites australis]
MGNGVEDVVGNANNYIGEQEESTGSIPSPLFSGTKPKKRLISKVWEDFIPTFVDEKLARAECMLWHRIFNCTGTTSGLRNHQGKCSPGTQKRPRQQERTSLPSTQKSTAALGSDPKQKKLPFLLSSQNGCTGTADATPVQKELHQNASHEGLAAPEQKNHALPCISTDKSMKNQSHGEIASFKILTMHGHHPRMMDQDGFKKLVTWLNPMVKMPSHSDLTRNFWNLYQQEESKLKKLTALCSRVCLSAYMCHYDPRLAFLCLSVYYIDDEWEKQQKIIRFRPVDPSCSAKELSAIILRAIGEWGLHGKVFSIILDDAFSDDSVASNVKASLQECNKVAANQSLFVVRYATYLLDQVIQIISAGVFDKLWDVKKEVHLKADMYKQPLYLYREEEAFSNIDIS